MTRKLGLIALTAALLALPGAAFAQGIDGTDHDFSASWSGGEICLPCHTPHFADTTVTDAPLWNHELTTQTFTLYTSTTLNAALAQPAGISKLCLSCHDGQTAMDNFGGATGGTEIIGGAGDLDVDLTDDHPVSFTYDTALSTADGGLHDPATTTAVSDLLFGGEVECASCHDVHNGAGIAMLLRLSNAESALCLTCHDK